MTNKRKKVRPVHTQADLHRHWHILMGELGFSAPNLWVQFLTADGQCLPVVPSIEDLPDRPEPVALANLMEVCAQVLGPDPGGRVAFLRSRPGSSALTGDDIAWARDLGLAARDAGLRCEPVHLATDESIVVFAPDDLVWRDTA
ncbi:MAG TPA: hypothetical protein VFJ19_11705 [Nocardioidaceae bacterium]|nr:hypothetical protein [Nocardioidaceae bacterium]